MDQLRNAFESLSQWWFDLHFSRNQKKALSIIAAIVLTLSVLVVIRGNTQIDVAPEIIPILHKVPTGVFFQLVILNHPHNMSSLI
jgi:hypothetical protein